MMIKRCLAFLSMALAMCLGSFPAQAVERIAHATSCVVKSTASAIAESQLHGADFARHELTLSQWRTSPSTPITDAKPANLIALSNHFGLDGAAPFGVPDWDVSIKA